MHLLKKILKDIFITPEYLGAKGERSTAAKVKWSNFWGYKGKLLQNVYIPKQDGGTTEIDLLYITQKGIIVIESKNYSGYIFGSEKNLNWTSTLYAGKDWIGRKKIEKHQFYNPIWQNRTHIKFLRQYLNQDIKMYSIIDFSDHCELKNVQYTSENVYICYRNRLGAIIKEVWRNNEDILTQTQVENIYMKLYPLANQDQDVKLKHVQDIQQKLNNVDICPRCGGKLLLRTAKKGPNAGKQFYGCSNFPKCRFTKNL